MVFDEPAVPMQMTDFERFRAIVLRDLLLQAELRAVTDREAFVALVVQRGAQYGCRFTSDDVIEALRAGRRAWFERWIA